MDYFPQVSTFAKESKRVSTEEELISLLDSVLPKLGFSHYALVSQVDLTNRPTGAVNILKLPEDWVNHSRSMKYYADDPVIIAAQHELAPFEWEELDQKLDLSPKHRRLMQEAREFGLQGGFTVPVHAPGVVSGLCSFVSGSKGIDPDCLPAANFIGVYAFDAARRIAAKNQVLNRTHTRLTDRQRECLIMAAKGKSDSVIGCILGLGRDTVHMHVERAKRSYGVSSRNEAIVRALFESQIAYADVLSK